MDDGVDDEGEQGTGPLYLCSLHPSPHFRLKATRHPFPRSITSTRSTEPTVDAGRVTQRLRALPEDHYCHGCRARQVAWGEASEARGLARDPEEKAGEDPITRVPRELAREQSVPNLRRGQGEAPTAGACWPHVPRQDHRRRGKESFLRLGCETGTQGAERGPGRTSTSRELRALQAEKKRGAGLSWRHIEPLRLGIKLAMRFVGLDEEGINAGISGDRGAAPRPLRSSSIRLGKCWHRILAQWPWWALQRSTGRSSQRRRRRDKIGV